MSLTYNRAHTSKSIASAVLSFSLIVAISACSDNEESAKPEGNDSDDQVILISSQPAGDSGSIDDLIAGLDELENENLAATRFLEVTDPSALESSVRNAGQSGASVIVSAFPDMGDAITQVAPDFPDTEFVHIFAEELENPIENVTTLGFQVHEAMFVAGFTAATLSETGVVGWVGGDNSPLLSANFHGFEAGAKHADSEVRVLSAVVGSFSDPANGRDLALGMISQGADVIQTDASGSSIGVIEAAQQRGALVIADASGEVAAQYPETVIGTTFIRFGRALVTSVRDALEDDYSASHIDVGLGEEVVGMSIAESFIEGDSPRATDVEEVIDESAKVEGEIADGAISVEFDPSSI